MDQQEIRQGDPDLSFNKSRAKNPHKKAEPGKQASNSWQRRMNFHTACSKAQNERQLSMIYLEDIGCLGRNETKFRANMN